MNVFAVLAILLFVFCVALQVALAGASGLLPLPGIAAVALVFWLIGKPQGAKSTEDRSSIL